MSRGSSAAWADAQAQTGRVLVVAGTTTVSDSSSALPDRRLDAVRIHQDPRDTPKSRGIPVGDDPGAPPTSAPGSSDRVGVSRDPRDTPSLSGR